MAAMSSVLFAAIVDTLLPGGEVADDVSLPPASAIIDAGQPLPPEIMAAAGAGFAGLDAAGREVLLAEIALALPMHWQALLKAVLENYYSDPRILRAFHWRAEPPQPGGHELPECDWSILDQVKARKPFWR